MDFVKISIEITDWRDVPAHASMTREDIIQAIVTAARKAAENKADDKDVAVRVHEFVE